MPDVNAETQATWLDSGQWTQGVPMTDAYL